MMRHATHRVVLLLTAVMLLALVSAGSALAGDAGRESPFALGAGARSLAMGGGVTAYCHDAVAIYYNPSGLARLEYQEFAFQHTVLFEKSIYDVASWVYPINENHGFGIGFMRLGTGDITRRVDFADRGEFGYSHSQLLFGYGRNFGEPLTTGVTLKIVNQSMDEFSDFAVAADVGFGLQLAEHLAAGGVVRDLIPAKLQLDSTSERTPWSLQGGLSWHDLSISPYVKVTLSADVEKAEDREVKLHGGAEVVLHDHYSFRGGYDRDDVAFGAGLQHGRLSIDYAYKLVDYVEDLHHFSVSLLVGKSVEEQVRLRELAKLPPEPTEEEKRFAALMDTANYYMHRFQLDSAASFFRSALDYDPGNQEIIGSLAAIAESRRVQQEKEQQLQDARAELNQTINSFLTQAELLLARRSYSASMDLLDLIFDIEPANPRAQLLKRQIDESRTMEITAQLEAAQEAELDKRLVDAIEAYNRVLEIDPGHVGAKRAKERVLTTMGLPEKIRLGMDLYEQGRLAEARRQFQQILEVNPDETVAEEYLKKIDQPPVRTSSLEDLQRDPAIWSLYLDGLRHMRNKDYQAAIDAWTKVLEAYPNNPNTLNNIEQARLRLGTQEPESKK